MRHKHKVYNVRKMKWNRIFLTFYCLGRLISWTIVLTSLNRSRLYHHTEFQCLLTVKSIIHFLLYCPRTFARVKFLSTRYYLLSKQNKNAAHTYQCLDTTFRTIDKNKCIQNRQAVPYLQKFYNFQQFSLSVSQGMVADI